MDQKTKKTIKEKAWDIWLSPKSCGIKFRVFILLLIYFFYAVVLYNFSKGEDIITGPYDLITRVVNSFQNDQVDSVSITLIFFGLLVHVGMPSVLTIGLIKIWNFVVYPTNQENFLQRVKFFEATETKRLLRKLLIEQEEELCEIFESARGHGADLSIDDIKKYALYYIELTDSNKFMMTTLYSPQEIYSDTPLKAAVHSLTRKIIDRGKSLTRICIGMPEEFDEMKYPDAMKWFKDIHAIDSNLRNKQQEVKMFYVPKSTAKLYGSEEINSRADVLVLGENLAFALGTNKDTLEVPLAEYRLFLLEKNHDIDAYKHFFNSLLSSEEAKQILIT